MSDNCFMGPKLQTSAISTHRDSTEDSVGLTVSVKVINRMTLLVLTSPVPTNRFLEKNID